MQRRWYAVVVSMIAAASVGFTTPKAGAWDVIGDEGMYYYQSPTSGRVMNSGTVAMVRTQVGCVKGRTAFVEVKIAWPPHVIGGTAEGQSAAFTCSGDKQVVWTPVYPADPALPIPTGEVWLNAVTMWATCDAEVSGICAAVFDGDYGIVMRGSGG